MTKKQAILIFLSIAVFANIHYWFNFKARSGDVIWHVAWFSSLFLLLTYLCSVIIKSIWKHSIIISIGIGCFAAVFFYEAAQELLRVNLNWDDYLKSIKPTHADWFAYGSSCLLIAFGLIHIIRSIIIKKHRLRND